MTECHQVSKSEIEPAIARNLAAVHEETIRACVRAGRATESVRLVAVTKYADWAWVEALSQTHRVFGENRPQQLAERQALLPAAEWHLIGQLQRNKVRLALDHAALIHSVDSIRLLDRITAVSRELGLRPQLLLQVNVSGERSKAGFSPGELKRVWEDICEFTSVVQIQGLMTMAPESSDPEEARPVFSALRRLRDELSGCSVSRARDLSLPELSMGMSADFVPAIEEGATLIRIGSRIFEGLDISVSF